MSGPAPAGREGGRPRDGLLSGMLTEADAPYDPSMIDGYTEYRKYFAEALEAMGRPRSDLAAHLEVSKSMLSQILSFDRRVNPNYASRVADFFRLDLDGRLTLAALIDLDNDSARARRSALAAVEARMHYRRTKRPSDEVLEAMSTWYVGAIYNLALCDGFRSDPSWIAATVVPRISVDEAMQAMETLVAIGAMERESDGHVTAIPQEFWTEQQLPPGDRSTAMARLQRSLLVEAGEALGRFRANERNSSLAMFPLTEGQLAEMKARLREIERELIHVAISVEASRPNRVFALGIQLFPVSHYSDAEFPPEGED